MKWKKQVLGGELRSLPPSSMCTFWTSLLNLSIPDLPFPVLLSTLIRSRFQAKPATLLIPIDFSFPFRGGGALRYSVPNWLFFLELCGEWFPLPAYFFFSFLLGEMCKLICNLPWGISALTVHFVLLYTEWLAMTWTHYPVADNSSFVSTKIASDLIKWCVWSCPLNVRKEHVWIHAQSTPSAKTPSFLQANKLGMLPLVIHLLRQPFL